MIDSARVAFLRLLLLAAATLASGCESHASLDKGDARAAVVMYSGDLEAATAVARRHCAGYERQPRLIGTAIGTAYFECVPR